MGLIKNQEAIKAFKAVEPKWVEEYRYWTIVKHFLRSPITLLFDADPKSIAYDISMSFT